MDSERRPSDLRYRVGIDIGGTFTDFVVIDQTNGQIEFDKRPTTPKALWAGIEDSIHAMGVELDRVERIVHGTTIGLNTLIERGGGRTGLITTRGFRDVYEIARHNRIETYDLFYRKPEPLVRRRFRLEVRERMNSHGEVIEPLVEEDVLSCADTFRANDIDAIAVCLLHAYANPAHEVRVGALLSEAYPEAAVSLSHELVRQWREYERTSTTVVNAYVMPVIADYLLRAESSLSEAGYARPLFISQSSGSVLTARSARHKPVHTIMSGPASGAIAAQHIGALLGHANVIAFDMGGTSTDVSLVYEGALRVTDDSEVDRHPLMVPMIDVNSIGAGGGSIAWLNQAGALNVGPQSAGAEPGPVCYGRGGDRPTVTDANLVLGRLHFEHFLSGAIRLDRESAEKQIEATVGAPLGLDTIAAALGILEVANTKMGYAARAITLERGLDPTAFVLLAYGGAGPMHGCAVARALGVPEVIVPVGPGAFCALGATVADLRHDFARTFPSRLDEGISPEPMVRRFAEMADEATAVLEEEGFAAASTVFRRVLDMRYVGQEYTVSVPMPDEALDKHALQELGARFHRLHESRYGHASEGEPIEIVHLRLSALGPVSKPVPPEIERGGEQPDKGAELDALQAVFDGGAGTVRAPVYQRGELRAGNRIGGPAIVVEKTATTVIEPGFVCEVTARGHLSIRRAS